MPRVVPYTIQKAPRATRLTVTCHSTQMNVHSQRVTPVEMPLWASIAPPELDDLAHDMRVRVALSCRKCTQSQGNSS
jgi:hypothetical protein